MRSIHITFNVWDPPHPGERLRQLRFSWEKVFEPHPELTDYTKVTDLATGYLYALAIMANYHERVTNTSTSMLVRYQTLDGKIVTTNNPLQVSILRNSIIATGVRPPQLAESFQEYIARVGTREPNRRYIIVVSFTGTDDGPVDVLQFNNLEFLQGILSVLDAFRQPLIRYIVTIYDRDGVEYSIRR